MPLIVRILSFSLACCLVMAIAGFLQHTATPVQQRAAALRGDRWFQLKLDGQHLGYWHTSTYADNRGDWIFDSEQRFALKQGDPVTLRTHRVFAALAPHDLLVAEYLQSRRHWSESTRIERTEEGLIATFHQGGSQTPSRRAETMNWEYTLADYLDFEVWLNSEQPDIGTSRMVRGIDFSRLAIASRRFDVVDINTEGYQVQHAAPFEATTIQLDERLAPVSMKMAGLFDLSLSSKSAALAPRSALQAASYFVPINRPLTDHTRTARIVLAVNGEAADRLIWPQIDSQSGENLLVLESNPLSDQSAGPMDLAESLGFPTTHRDIEALARKATAGFEAPADKAYALTHFVHDYLEYRPGTPPKPVLSLLGDPVGDCTEFADLFTTLARSVGIPTRTVFGLAYTDQPQPAFAFHAWNEVSVAGQWQALDPTWNQTTVDATHIPMPQSESASLQLLTGNVDLEFALREVEYFNSPNSL